ncbi:hypothetical protein LBMAG56_04010 [Verrucomicrobiota bacterium]|nr:hypothetical protein LBMAG56_04010 [Verrucomicrobiota bacterium]
MRFQRLQIPAFGPFTNLELQFAEQPADLHVIYGANEAGKSSLLRAIRDLLFGVHGQSADNFLHDYGELRIKGEILNRSGQKLIFQRRKGNRNTLLAEDGTQLPDHALTPFLGSVDEPYFSAMFGLGARELNAGAQQLLRGEGHMGNALFSASLGGTPVQKIIAALQLEAERLFKGRATANVSIRPAVSRYKELLRQSRDAVVNPETWDKLEQELAEAEAAKQRLAAEITKLDRELHWIARCEDALPTVGRLGEELQKLAQLPPLPDLAGDFVIRAQGARAAAAKAQGEVQRLTGDLGEYRRQLLECQTAPAVLAQADTLDQLHQDFGVYRERKQSLADVQIELAGLEPVLRAGMQNLQLAGEFAVLENHRLSSAVRLACEAAANALTDAVTKQADNSGKTAELAQEIEGVESQLQALPEANLTGIRDALELAAEATEADRTFSTSEAEVERLTRATADQHRRVAGAPEDWEATAGLRVPASATIRCYHDQLDGHQRDLKTEQNKIAKSNKRAAEIQAELGRLQRRGELPTEEALRQARQHRDHGWSLVLAEWKGGGTQQELVPGVPLAEAFPKAVAKADELADQLRQQAEAVAQAEEKRSQLRELEVQTAAEHQRIAEIQAALAACHAAWQTEWAACGITPRSPLEMEEWCEQRNEFRNRLANLRTAEAALQQKRDQIHVAKQSLSRVLGRDEQTAFRGLYHAARELVQRGERDSGRREEMTGRLASLKRDLAKFEKSRVRLDQAVNTATEHWQVRCAAVGLPAGTSPAAGLTLLRERQDLLARFDEWQTLSLASRSTAQAVAQYEKAIREQATALGFPGDTTEARESALWRALAEARDSQVRHDQLARQIARASRELTEAQGIVSQAEQTLKELVALAGLTQVAELEPLLAHLEKRDKVQGQIDSLRNTLSGLARGQAVDEFVATVRAENPDALAGRKPVAAQEKTEKESALQTISKTLFQLETQKKQLEKAGDDAADFRQQAESCAATLRQDAARFLRLRLATHFLENQIERFRKENQGPLLQKSGALFQAITRGAFSGLGAVFQADDVPVLVGVRPDQSTVPVEGLSDGSRDQLYLALRLAALDRYLEEHEPMPLILDDLLITFDNDRTKAILPQLGALAKRTQIFLFTHHEHLVELCRQTLGEDQFHLHRLGGGA